MKKKVRLSASRIDTFLMCSWLYYFKYILKAPDSSNDGAKRGDVTHLILEVLLNPRHRHHFDKITKEGTCKNDKPIWSLIQKRSKKHQIDDDNNLNLIDNFILVALSCDFFGDEYTEEILSEKVYEFEVDTEDKKYFVVAKIDKIFLKKKGSVSFVEVVDYKTSSKKFEGKKIDFNIQEFVYTLAAHKLFPKAKSHDLSFLFLKFPNFPKVESSKISFNELDGFEYYLTNLQEILNDFTEDHATSNFAATKGYPKPEEGFCGLLKCGYAKQPGQLKKDGTLMFHCEAKFPFDYYSVEKDGEILRSAFNQKELVAGEGETIVKKNYKGCKYFNLSRYKS